VSQRPDRRPATAPGLADRLPEAGPARKRMLRAVARLLWQQEQQQRRLRRLREVAR